MSLHDHLHRDFMRSVITELHAHFVIGICPREKPLIDTALWMIKSWIKLLVWSHPMRRRWHGLSTSSDGRRKEYGHEQRYDASCIWDAGTNRSAPQPKIARSKNPMRDCHSGQGHCKRFSLLTVSALLAFTLRDTDWLRSFDPACWETR